MRSTTITAKINIRFVVSILLITLFAITTIISIPWIKASAEGASSVNIWWPSNGAHMIGVQPFKAMVPGLDVTDYEMFWQVDGGSWVWMDNNYTDYQHKEASVNIMGWNWHGQGPYTVNFIARKNGAIIAEQSITIYNDGAQVPAPVVVTPTQTPATSTAVVTPSPAPVATASAPAATPVATQPVAPSIALPTITLNQSAPAAPAPSVSDTLYVNPDSNAAHDAASLSGDAASAMRVLASAPTASWFGGWNSNVENDVHSLISAASAVNQTPVLVAYDIPERDCGGFSAGGTNNAAGYTSWINAFATGIGPAKAIVILEPDALAQISCLSSSDQQTRLNLLSNAVSTLKANPNTKVYIDAGHAGWIDGSTMASRLQSANIAHADGFALNTSNFDTTSSETSYGTEISTSLGGAHFVIDTSRNGNGSNGEWCNPWGRAIGIKPTLSTGNSRIDAYLWVKTPGESDGNCNGGPNAGVWWQSYALSLVP